MTLGGAIVFGRSFPRKTTPQHMNSHDSFASARAGRLTVRLPPNRIGPPGGQIAANENGNLEGRGKMGILDQMENDL
jgi:hypothetical protein